MMEDVAYGWEPLVAIIADGPASARIAEDCVAAAGGRASARVDLQGADALLAGTNPAAVLVYLADTIDPADETLGRVLHRLNAAAAAQLYPSVVVLPLPLVDLAIACAPHEDMALIVDDGGPEPVAALALALAPKRAFAMEERGDETPGQLRRLREEVSRIARTLAEMSGDDLRGVHPPAPLPEPPPAMREAPFAAQLRALLRARRLREQMFAADLFADPAWDMLLDLMLARVEGRLVAVSSLCIAAAVPPTTALRWIKRLTEEGLFVRSADPRDGRRVFIDLSDACAARMGEYLRALAGG